MNVTRERKREKGKVNTWPTGDEKSDIALLKNGRLAVPNQRLTYGERKKKEKEEPACGTGVSLKKNF